MKLPLRKICLNLLAFLFFTPGFFAYYFFYYFLKTSKKNQKIIVCIIAFGIISFPLFLFWADSELEKEFWRVHPDEVEVRDWIHSVRGTANHRSNSERHITVVCLDNCDIVDDDLIRLKQLSRLNRLDLSNTNITDKAIPTLLSIDTLYDVDFSNTKVSKEGWLQFIDGLNERFAKQESKTKEPREKVDDEPTNIFD